MDTQRMYCIKTVIKTEELTSEWDTDADNQSRVTKTIMCLDCRDVEQTVVQFNILQKISLQSETWNFIVYKTTKEERSQASFLC